MKCALFWYGILVWPLWGLSCAPWVPAQTGGGKVDNPVPFEIRLRAINGPGLRAVLRNTSAKEQTFLHHPTLQPSRVVLTNAAGQAVTPEDSRAVEKQDATVYRSLYAKLP